MLWPKNHLCYLMPVGDAGTAAGELWAPLFYFLIIYKKQGLFNTLILSGGVDKSLNL